MSTLFERLEVLFGQHRPVPTKQVLFPASDVMLPLGVVTRAKIYLLGAQGDFFQVVFTLYGREYRLNVWRAGVDDFTPGLTADLKLVEDHAPLDLFLQAYGV